MPLTEEENETVNRLVTRLHVDHYPMRRLEAYYEGHQRLEQLGLAVPEALRRFVTIVNWPAMGADGVEERLDLEGFRFPGSDEADEELWRIWQDNDLDEESQLAHLDSFIYGRSYVSIGTNEADRSTPLVSVESPLEVIHETDTRTRQVTAALRLYITNDRNRTPRATLYLPNATIWIVRDSRGRWAEEDRDQHNIGAVPVVPIVNKARTAKRVGISEMADLISLTDAAARSLTNLQVAQETHAVPQRGVLGASEGDFVDQDGQPLTVWEAYFGAVWALENADAKTFQFSASDLRNFDTTVQLYARLASGVSALPPNYFGLAADDAASADAIRSREARLVKKCERKIRTLSGSWERAMRIVLRFATGEWNDDARRLEALWRDPSTPTVAQVADAVVKKVQVGILPREGAWEDLGYTASRRERLRRQFAEQTASDPIGMLARQVSDPEPEPAAV